MARPKFGNHGAVNVICSGEGAEVGTAMLEYRCYLLGMDGRITARHEFTASGDSEALAAARALYAQAGLRHGFELWENKRRVHREE